eukprot:GDKJ01046967.1.p1 GENE.GDKJ01046967.1~~GDKJ01046967.1.p1  ORF type:complete len:143 (+),score=38.35 GDKJ01046967.1:27-431(+)
MNPCKFLALLSVFASANSVEIEFTNSTISTEAVASELEEENMMDKEGIHVPPERDIALMYMTAPFAVAKSRIPLSAQLLSHPGVRVANSFSLGKNTALPAIKGVITTRAPFASARIGVHRRLRAGEAENLADSP